MRELLFPPGLKFVGADNNIAGSNLTDSNLQLNVRSSMTRMECSAIEKSSEQESYQSSKTLRPVTEKKPKNWCEDLYAKLHYHLDSTEEKDTASCMCTLTKT